MDKRSSIVDSLTKIDIALKRFEKEKRTEFFLSYLTFRDDLIPETIWKLSTLRKLSITSSEVCDNRFHNSRSSRSKQFLVTVLHS